MIFVDVLKECESANGAGSKKVIQSALAKLDATGRKLTRYMMDPYTTFGVKAFDQPQNFQPTDSAIEPFFELLDELAARALTGNSARLQVSKALGMFTEETAQYLERVLDKNPRAGFSADTFNKIWPDDPIPSWDEQLAEKCEDGDEFEERCTFPAQADVKYDGNRQFAFVRAGQPVEWYARGGKPSNHLTGLFDEELLRIREAYGVDYVLDGEALAATFTQTQNAKKGGNDADKKALIFRAFFIMPVTDWIAQKTDITNRQAREKILELTKDLTRIKPTEGKIVNSYHEMTEYCNEVIDDTTKTSAEREGLIVKQLDAVYEWGRSFAWIKVKRFYDVDARIVGFYEARPKTRFAKLGLIGGVNCVAFLESGERVEFNVGSGFNFKDREDMRANPEKWLKGTHVIKYQEVSQAKGKDVRSLRFCTYEHSRDDKLVEI